MKTMGLTNLWLVNPLVKPDSQAIALAAGASDVIGNAHIVDTLDEALAGCSLVVGTSARSRTLPWPMLDPRECGLKSVAEAANTPVALVFGRERVGLTNEELQKCHYHVALRQPEYSSLNFAMAVQVIALKCAAALRQSEKRQQVERRDAVLLVDDLERFMVIAAGNRFIRETIRRWTIAPSVYRARPAGVEYPARDSLL